MCVCAERARKNHSSITSILLIFNIWVYLTFIHRNIYLNKLPFRSVYIQIHIRVVLPLKCSHFLSCAILFLPFSPSLSFSFSPFVPCSQFLVHCPSSLFVSHEWNSRMAIEKFYFINFILYHVYVYDDIEELRTSAVKLISSIASYL